MLVSFTFNAFFIVVLRIKNEFPRHTHNTLYDLTSVPFFRFVFWPCFTSFIVLYIPVMLNFLQTPKGALFSLPSRFIFIILVLPGIPSFPFLLLYLVPTHPWRLWLGITSWQSLLNGPTLHVPTLPTYWNYSYHVI